MLAIFLELNSKGLHQSSGKEKKVVVFCSRPRQNVRQFHVVVVQQLAEKCTKKRDARAKLLFCLSKPIAYLLFSLRKLTKVTSLAPSQHKRKGLGTREASNMADLFLAADYGGQLEL